MKINVSSISRSVDSSMETTGTVNKESIVYGSETIIFNSPIQVKVLVTNTGDHLLINGRIETSMVLKCSRCLESFVYNLDTPFEEELSNRDDSDDVIHFVGDILDLTDIVINNIMLSLPMKFVCSDSCKGLCPKCGKNINVDKCSCVDENYDPRLEVLKDLLKGN